MNRREFTAGLAFGAAYFALGSRVQSASRNRPQVAITMDDFNWNKSLLLNPDQRNDAILSALATRKLKATLFVAGKFVDNQPKGQALLRAWSDAGHTIGNHSYSHHELNSDKVTAEAFTADILKGAAVINRLPKFRKTFRFPYLKEGDTLEKRDTVRAFLRKHGYRNGHVTIDASDWAVDSRLTERLKKQPTADMTPYRDFHLEHMWQRSAYYDDLAYKVLNRPVKHTVLVHFNLLNALFLKDLMNMYVRRGWELLDADDAFRDPLFTAAPNILPAGESLIWALAKESGKFEKLLRYPGEDAEYENARMDKLRL